MKTFIPNIRLLIMSAALQTALSTFGADLSIIQNQDATMFQDAVQILHSTASSNAEQILAMSLIQQKSKTEGARDAVDQSIGDLIILLADADTPLRQNAAKTIGIGSPATIDKALVALSRNLNDPDQCTRLASIMLC